MDDHTYGTAVADPELAAHGRPLPAGHTIAERYEIRAVLGQGGMGTVYRVHDRELDEDVALKVLRPDLASTPDALVRFRREVKLARRVTHPNVARTYDLGAHHGVRYLTMQLIAGQPLHGPCSLAEMLRIASQIAQGLAAAHAAGVVHRDLKPANVLVEGERAIITDFGIACTADPDDALRTNSIAIGTPAYIAPEQLEGSNVDGRADVYALGVVLYQLLADRLPFDGETPAAIALARLARDPLPLPASAAPGCVAQLVTDMLARRRDARPDAHTVVERLAGMRGGRRAAEPPPEPRAQRRVHVARLDADAATGAHARDLATAIADALVGEAGLEIVRDGEAPAAVELTVRAADRPPGDGRSPDDGREPDDGRARRGPGGKAEAGDRRVRVRMRLVDEHGVAWAARVEGATGDPFALEDAVAEAVVAALRERRATAAGPQGAIRERYEAARLALIAGPAHARTGIATLEQLLAEQPSNAWVASLLACGLVRLALQTGADDAATFARAEELALRALELDPTNGQSYYAIASIRSAKGEHAETLAAAREAIRRAPALAGPHVQLGRLLGWTGRIAEALHELELAIRLDPSSHDAAEDKVRLLALTGDRPGALAELARLERRVPNGGVLARLRLYAWWADRELARDTARLIAAQPSGGSWEAARPGLEAYADGDLATMRAIVDREMARLITERVFPRQRAFMAQIAIEQYLLCGAADAASTRLLELAEQPSFIDLLWLDRCPSLAVLRGGAEHARARAIVAERVAGLDV